MPCQLIFLKRSDDFGEKKIVGLMRKAVLGSFSDGRVVMDSARILAMVDSMVATGLVAAAMWRWNG